MHHLSEAKKLATLETRSTHSEADRRYLTERIDGLIDLISGPDGLTVKLTRVEEKLDHLEKREQRHWLMLTTLMPILAVAAQYLIGLL